MVPSVDEIPEAHTPPGGWTAPMPPPILDGCEDPLVEGAPDLRGVWTVTEVRVEGEVDSDHAMLGKQQRIEQAADRLVVTAGRVIHDMRCDGTLENGVDDVAEIDLVSRIRVAATYEDGTHVLRPDGLPVEVTRRLDGDEMVWTYGSMFEARCRRP